MRGSSNDFSKKIENCPKYGGLSEWFMELVLKTSDGVKPTVSSNLTASANNNAHPNEVGFVVLMQEREIRTIKCNSPVDCCLPPGSTAATPLFPDAASII